MANNLVSTDYNPLIVAGNALSRSISSPELSSAGGGISRTILIARMLAGGSESDVAIAHLLCLPHSETFGLAIFGEPSGPTFKTHRDDRRARFDPSDAGAVGTIGWDIVNNSALIHHQNAIGQRHDLIKVFTNEQNTDTTIGGFD